MGQVPVTFINVFCSVFAIGMFVGGLIWVFQKRLSDDYSDPSGWGV